MEISTFLILIYKDCPFF